MPAKKQRTPKAYIEEIGTTKLSDSITIRLPQLRERLHNAADVMDLSENDLARHAIRALVDCIEANGGRLLWPPKFYVEGDKRRVEI